MGYMTQKRTRKGRTNLQKDEQVLTNPIGKGLGMVEVGANFVVVARTVIRGPNQS